MNRKGLFETIALAVVTMMIVGVFSVLGTRFLVDLNQIVRRETVGLAAGRVSTSIYAVNSVEKADQQINFPYGYNIYPNDVDDDGSDELIISFSYNDKTGSAQIASAEWIDDFSITSEVQDQGKKRNYCVRKRPSGATLDVGRCN